MSALRVIEAGLRSTVQDLGRFGHLRSAVPPAGPADPSAFEAAQALVGNTGVEAAIEIVGLPFRCVLESPRLIAVAGRGVSLRTRGRVAGWTAVFARADEEILVDGSDTRYAYLAVSGALALEPVLGSRASYLPARLGPLARPLAAGDRLPLGAPRYGAERAGRTLAAPYDRGVHVLRGPHAERFRDADAFLAGQTFRASERSDRMGVRLEGPPLDARSGEILSIGVLAGAIQVPSGGEPIVLLADHQTTGGYPVIATVVRTDLGAVAQTAPGEELSFHGMEREAAVARLRAWRQVLSG